MSDTIHEVCRKVGKACQYAQKVLENDKEALKTLDNAVVDFGQLVNNFIFLASILRSLDMRSPEEIRQALEATKREVEARKEFAEGQTGGFLQ